MAHCPNTTFMCHNRCGMPHVNQQCDATQGGGGGPGVARRNPCETGAGRRGDDGARRARVLCESCRPAMIAT
eukprot:3685138-Pyramimonas_sp.AAC.1